MASAQERFIAEAIEKNIDDSDSDMDDDVQVEEKELSADEKRLMEVVAKDDERHELTEKRARMGLASKRIYNLLNAAESFEYLNPRGLHPQPEMAYRFWSERNYRHQPNGYNPDRFAELQTDSSGIMIDLDCYQLDRKQSVTEKHIINICKRAAFIIGSMFHLDKCKVLDMLVTAKPVEGGILQWNEKHNAYKDGYHIMCPSVLMTRECRLYILRAIAESKEIKDMKDECKLIEDPVDMAAAHVPVFLVGCEKITSNKKHIVFLLLESRIVEGYIQEPRKCSRTRMRDEGYLVPFEFALNDWGPIIGPDGREMREYCRKAEYKIKDEIARKLSEIKAAAMSDRKIERSAEEEEMRLMIRVRPDSIQAILDAGIECLGEQWMNETSKWKLLIKFLKNICFTYEIPQFPIFEMFERMSRVSPKYVSREDVLRNWITTASSNCKMIWLFYMLVKAGHKKEASRGVALWRERFGSIPREWEKFIARDSSLINARVASFDASDPYRATSFIREFNSEVFDSELKMLEVVLPKLARVFALIAGGRGAYVKKTNTEKLLFDIVPKYGGGGLDMSFKYKDEKKKLVTIKFDDFVRNKYSDRVALYDTISASPIAKEGEFNTWQGISSKPAAEIDMKVLGVMLDFYRNVWFSGNNDLMRYFLRWLKRLVCEQSQRTNTMLFVHGDYGAGKNAGVNFIQYWMIGKKGSLSANGVGSVTGNFNSLLLGRRLIVIQEVAEHKDSFVSDFNKLKTLVTEDEIIIEPKGGERYTMDNYMCFIALSNYKSFMADPRRHFCVEVSNSKVDDRDYFDMLHKTCFNQACADMMHKYLDDLDEKELPRINEVPKTELLEDLVSQSRPSSIKFIAEVKESVDSGSSDYLLGEDDNLTPIIPASVVYNRYQMWCRAHGEQATSSSRFASCVRGFIAHTRKSSGVFYDVSKIKKIR